MFLAPASMDRHGEGETGPSADRLERWTVTSTDVVSRDSDHTETFKSREPSARTVFDVIQEPPPPRSRAAGFDRRCDRGRRFDQRRSDPVPSGLEIKEQLGQRLDVGQSSPFVGAKICAKDLQDDCASVGGLPARHPNPVS